MTYPMTRRGLLAAAPALLAPSAAPLAAPALAAPVDPVLPLYEEWRAARAEWYRLAELPGNDDWDWPESHAAEAREWAAFDAILNTAPTSPEGLAALVHVLWDREGPSCDPDHAEYEQRCEKDGNRLIRMIWRATTGRDRFPTEV